MNFLTPPSRQSVNSPVVIVLRRRRVELPPLLVALLDLRLALQLLVVLVLHTDRLADVVDDVLVGGRVVAARRLVAGAVRRLPVGVDAAAGQGWVCFVFLLGT